MKYIVIILCFSILPCFAEELIVTGSEGTNILAYNVFENGYLGINDIGFKSGGIDDGEPGDTDTIILARPSGYSKRFMYPRLIAVGVAIETSHPLTLELGMICQRARWDYGTLTVAWNHTQLGIIDTNTGKTENQATFTFHVPTDAVKKENVLWITPLRFDRRIYFDAAKITSPDKIRLLCKSRTKTLFEQTMPCMFEKRHFEDIGKALVINEFRVSNGFFTYEMLEPLHVSVTQRNTWLAPAEWQDFKLVALQGRFKSQKNDGRAIGQYLNNGGCIIMTAAFLQSFQSANSMVSSDFAWIKGIRAVWSRNASRDDVFIGEVQENSLLLPDLFKPGDKKNWYGAEMSRFILEPDSESKLLIKVKSSATPSRYEASLFVKQVGNGHLIGVSMSENPDFVTLMRAVTSSILMQQSRNQTEPL